MLKLAEEVNDYASNIVRNIANVLVSSQHSLPLVDQSVQFIDKALDEQHALGFTLPTNVAYI